MVLQPRFMCKCHFAYVAFKGFLQCVSFFRLSQIVHIIEASTTKFTTVWFLISMYYNVAYQMCLCRKTFQAFVTLVGLLSIVSFLVHFVSLRWPAVLKVFPQVVQLHLWYECVLRCPFKLSSGLQIFPHTLHSMLWPLWWSSICLFIFPTHVKLWWCIANVTCVWLLSHMG